MLLRLALVLAAAVALASAAPAAARPGADRSCGLYTDRYGYTVGMLVVRGPVSCTTTRRVLRRYLTSKAPCDGSACLRSHYGWTCVSAKSYDWPELVGCTRGRLRIEAHALAD
jgi:hypothetical protein